MDIKGVCYDTGLVYPGHFLTRRLFDPATTRRAGSCTLLAVADPAAGGRNTVSQAYVVCGRA